MSTWEITIETGPEPLNPQNFTGNKLMCWGYFLNLNTQGSIGINSPAEGEVLKKNDKPNEMNHAEGQPKDKINRKISHLRIELTLKNCE